MKVNENKIGDVSGTAKKRNKFYFTTAVRFVRHLSSEMSIPERGRRWEKYVWAIKLQICPMMNQHIEILYIDDDYDQFNLAQNVFTG